MDPVSARPSSIRGRGAAANPANRFERLHVELDPGEDGEDRPGPRTLFLRDASRSILAENDSPDVPFDVSVNPYRGCEVGCAYCYARPFHEYLGFSSGLDFETRILVKERAPELLARALRAPSWRPRPIAISGVTDCYQPVERRLRLTRGCLEVLRDFRNPVTVVTKNRLVVRDLDVLGEMAALGLAAVAVTVTTLDESLAGAMEPRATRPRGRLDAIRTLAEAGVPTGVLVAPVVPGLTDHEIPAILAAAAEAGATEASYAMLRLPHGVEGIFADFLARHLPERRSKVLNRLRDLRGGRLTDGRFGTRMRGEGPFADQVLGLFRAGLCRAGLRRAGRGPGGRDGSGRPALRTDLFRPPRLGGQGVLFDEA
jgi:DNA repair photolyase